MKRTLMVLFSGSGLLAIFCMALMQYFGFVYDYYFAWVVPGSVLFGAGCGLALFSWCGRHEQSTERVVTGMHWLAGSALAGVGCLSALLYLPIGPIYLFLLQVAIISLPYLVWTYGARMLASVEGFNHSWGVTAVAIGVAAGLFASPLMLDHAGGAIRTGWVVCILLSVVVLGGARRQSFAFAAISVAMVAGLAGYQITTTQYSLPRWQPDSPYLVKPILGALSAGKKMSSRPLIWNGAGRTDLLASASKKAGYAWVITNATAPVPIVPGEQPLSWLQERFPLVTIPLVSANAESLMSIGSIAGPEVAIAKHLKIPVINTETYNNFTMGLSGERPAIASDMVYKAPDTFTGLRHASGHDNENYDLVFLPITHPVKSGWAGSNTDEVFLYTKEAIRNYWSRLDDGGMLAVTVRNEILFVRMLLTLWDMLSEQKAIGGKEFVKQVWGVRLVHLAPYKGSYQFLLMAIKGTAKNHQSQKIKEMIEQLPVEVLFGPGTKAVKPYNLIEISNSDGNVSKGFTKGLSRRIKKRVDLRVATDLRPYFFHIIRDAHPYMKWLLTACLGILLPVLLFPLTDQRRPGAQGGSDCPPLPVILGYFGFLGGVMVMVAMAVVQQVSLWPLVLIVSMIAGLAVSGIVFRKSTDKNVAVSGWAPVLLILMLAVIYWLVGFPNEVNMGHFSTFRFIVLAVSCLIFAMSAGISLQSGMRQIKAVALHDLLPWAWIVTGVMALAATVLVYWFSMLWGWNYVWGVAAAASLLIFGAGVWMKRWFIQPQKS